MNVYTRDHVSPELQMGFTFVRHPTDLLRNGTAWDDGAVVYCGVNGQLVRRRARNRRAGVRWLRAYVRGQAS